jgi:hypothetical protein
LTSVHKSSGTSQIVSISSLLPICGLLCLEATLGFPGLPRQEITQRVIEIVSQSADQRSVSSGMLWATSCQKTSCRSDLVFTILKILTNLDAVVYK